MLSRLYINYHYCYYHSTIFQDYILSQFIGHYSIKQKKKPQLITSTLKKKIEWAIPKVTLMRVIKLVYIIRL